MYHVAIMDPKLGLIPRILSGEKYIESRWYLRRTRPWNRIDSGDVIYFKDAGKPVSARAVVGRVRQYENPTKKDVARIIEEFGQGIGAGFIPGFEERVRNKKYCVLVWLRSPEMVAFEIDKRKAGIAIGSAWITVDSIGKIMRT